MALWTFTQVSDRLGCTVQNITNRKAKLKSMGFIEQDTDGKEKINENGYNYLLEQRKKTFESNVNKFSENSLNNQENAENINDFSTKQQEYIIELYKQQIEELKNEKEYYKKQYEAKDQELKDKNLYIQELNTKAFALLGTAEDNKKQSEESKKGFFARLFK